jgi:hypothetical protein
LARVACQGRLQLGEASGLRAAYDCCHERRSDQLKKLERDLWSAAEKLRANSDLKASEYSTPVLGLTHLKFADNEYRQRSGTRFDLA